MTRTQEMQHALHEVYDPQPSDRYDGTSRPAPLDEVVNGSTESRPIPGGGIVRAIGIVAVLAFLGNVIAQVWPK